MNKAQVGKRGETVAARYLKRHGYDVLERNLHISHQEIDIIAIDRTNLIFVEVKTRTIVPDAADRYSTPAAAVNYQKQSHLLRAAGKYCAEHHYSQQPRMDVIEVFLAPDETLTQLDRIWEWLTGLLGIPHRRVLHINHIENAFGLHGYRP